MTAMLRSYWDQPETQEQSRAETTKVSLVHTPGNCVTCPRVNQSNYLNDAGKAQRTQVSQACLCLNETGWGVEECAAKVPCFSRSWRLRKHSVDYI